MPRHSVPLLDAIAAARLGPFSGGTPGGPATGANLIVLDEFLARPELDTLVDWVAERESEFGHSRVVSPAGDGQLDQGHRRSKVLFAMGPLQAVVEQRLMSVFDYVRLGLGLPSFPVGRIEMQITASNDGEYFRAHTDNSHELLVGRNLTYVYFFHREPARFSGGRLRFYGRDGARATQGGAPLVELVPRQNQVVFFPAHHFHEIETISCPSRRFLDSRFTVNGWYRTS